MTKFFHTVWSDSRVPFCYTNAPWLIHNIYSSSCMIIIVCSYLNKHCGLVWLHITQIILNLHLDWSDSTIRAAKFCHTIQNRIKTFKSKLHHFTADVWQQLTHLFTYTDSYLKDLWVMWINTTWHYTVSCKVTCMHIYLVHMSQICESKNYCAKIQAKKNTYQLKLRRICTQLYTNETIF